MAEKLLPDHLTVPEYAKEKEVSTTAIYNAIDAKRIEVSYVGRQGIAFIHPKWLKIEFRKKKSVK